VTTISYPAKGTGGFDIDQWATYFDGYDGIINDLDTTTLTLSRINVGDIARYSPGKIRVGGYVLEVTANHDLAVSTAAGTYYTWACYDPALNIAGGGGEASVTGPCTLGISTGLPSTAGGKQYFLLDRIVRAAAQSLTAATVASYRRWIGPGGLYMKAWPSPLGSYETEAEVDLTGFGPYPVGSRMQVGQHTYVRQPEIGGTEMLWMSQSGRLSDAFPANSPLVAQSETPQYYIIGRHLYCQGNLKRSSGAVLNTGADVLLGTLPFAPAEKRRFAVAGTGGRTVVAIVHGEDTPATEGNVYMTDPPTYVGNVSWIDLSGIHFQIGA
jgi:hypothetical protein